LVVDTWTRNQIDATSVQLHAKLTQLRKEIIKWRKGKVGDLQGQEEICMVTLDWIGKQSERRMITELEKLIYKEMEQRYKQIAMYKESIWRQRAKHQWIKEGNQNTSYFHMMATTQKRQNAIHTLRSDQTQHCHTSHNEKARILFQYFCGLIGSKEQSDIQFDFQQIFQTNEQRMEIDTQISEQEILHAINSWPSQKVSGLDGYTGEFYK
jgi:hypothetical protein